MDNWTLGIYIKWVTELGLVDKKIIPVLQKFKKVRNLAVHDYSYMEQIVKNPERQAKLRALIGQIVDLIEQYKTQYERDPSQETKHAEFLGKRRKKVGASGI